jgi:hypothetical protein
VAHGLSLFSVKQLRPLRKCDVAGGGAAPRKETVRPYLFLSPSS